MKIRRKALAAAVGFGLLTALLPLTASAADDGPNAVALTGGGTRLGRFNVDRPGALTAIGGTITGLAGDNRLVGIDRRVQNGRLYGVGNSGGIYLMSGSTASKVGQLSVPLVGTSFGVDFNPAANALRIVSNQAQNLRQPFGAGNNPAGDTVVDALLNQSGVPAGNIAGAAYTNNDRSALTATTLFVLDTELDQVAVQSPANSGTLVATGKLGVGAGADVGFDIYSEKSSSGDAAIANFAFATIPTGTANRFHFVDLLTGHVEYIGRFPTRVTDVAIDLDS
jgi:uncharacterized protein DUF4394